MATEAGSGTTAFGETMMLTLPEFSEPFVEPTDGWVYATLPTVKPVPVPVTVPANELMALVKLKVPDRVPVKLPTVLPVPTTEIDSDKVKEPEAPRVAVGSATLITLNGWVSPSKPI